MDRRLSAGLIGVFLGGCAHGISSMPEPRLQDPPARAEGESLRAIKNETDQSSKAQVDRSARRASTSTTKPAEAPAERPRPAPFADRTGEARVQALPPSGRDGVPSRERLAPYADQVPDGPRPQLNAPSRPLPEPVPPAVDPAPNVDAAVVKTSAVLAAPKSPERRTPNADSSRQAAKVGDEVITLLQLRAAYREDLQKVPQEERNDPRLEKYLIDQALNHLIQRSLLIQAAKRQMKDPKALQSFYDAIDKAWTEHEMPPMLREHGVKNIHELKVKLAERGKSLDQIREDFRLDNLAREFMMMKIQPKLSVTLPEKIKYYNAHVKDYDRPAQVVWREVAVDAVKCKSRDEARAKATALLARLKKGENFEKLARAESHGPTAKEGGKWETAPGGFAIPDVNDALASLPIGAISPVIEAPAGFHIVRVESRRDAGPARFDEVQDQVKDSVYREKVGRLTTKFIDDLREHTVITTMFDPPTNDPSAIRTGTTAAPTR